MRLTMLERGLVLGVGEAAAFFESIEVAEIELLYLPSPRLSTQRPLVQQVSFGGGLLSPLGALSPRVMLVLAIGLFAQVAAPVVGVGVGAVLAPPVEDDEVDVVLLLRA